MPNEPYQVYHERQDVGKRLKTSKKRVYWRLGLSPHEPTRKHEVLLVHSLISGKKIVFLDGVEVHNSKSISPTFNFQFPLLGSLISIGASDSSPYYLKVDSVNFRDLPYYTPPGSSSVGLSQGGVSSGPPLGGDMAVERERARRVMNDLDEDLNLALKIQEEENRISDAKKDRESEDERIARRMQEEYDREMGEHEEYLRKSGVDLEGVRMGRGDGGEEHF
ncbi:hypothetical protein TrRE_jg11582, partial [Triparma retinervis]